jgi:hypothetical protein
MKRKVWEFLSVSAHDFKGKESTKKRSNKFGAVRPAAFFRPASKHGSLISAKAPFGFSRTAPTSVERLQSSDFVERLRRAIQKANAPTKFVGALAKYD